MKALRKFLMEDALEDNRFHSAYNLGESGGRARTVHELLIESGLNKANAAQTFFDTKLCDSPNWGRADLRKIISDMHPGTSVDNVLITTGTSEALFLLFRSLNPKSVALATPAFQLLYEIPMAMGAKIIALPVRWDSIGKPFVDEAEWLKIMRTKKPSCLLLNNPHNPSGLIFSDEFMDKLHNIAKEIKCTLIGDEHYRFLSHPSEHLGKSFFKNNKKTFVTGSFIKCLGAPGLRIGWCVGPHAVLAQLQNEKNYTTHTVNPITEWISYEVLKNFDTPLFKTMKQEWAQNKLTLCEFLKNSDMIIGNEPSGGLVTALGFKQAKSMTHTRKLIQLLQSHGVFVLPLETMEFGAYDFQKEKEYLGQKLSSINKGFGFRLGLGCAPAEFKKALETIESVLSK